MGICHSIARQFRVVSFSVRAAMAYRKAGSEAESLLALHKTHAAELTKLFRELGGFFVKLGQIMSTQHRVIPEEYVRELSTLCDALPPLPGATILKTIKKELGEPGRFFDDFGSDAIAAASVAQVHRALLHGTQCEVAVKIQYPALVQQMNGDIFGLRLSCKLVQCIMPAVKHLDFFTRIMEEMIEQELNFENEARNAATMRVALARSGHGAQAVIPGHSPSTASVTIPLVHTAHSTARILTTDFIADAYHINDKKRIVAAGLWPSTVVAALSDLFATMIFVHSRVHGDLHAGNVLVRKRRSQKRSQADHAALEAKLKAEFFAEDVRSPSEAITWDEAAVHRFFESGGSWKPPAPAPPSSPDVELVLLDHGLHIPLSDSFREKYAKLWLALGSHSVTALKQAAANLGAPEIFDLLPPAMMFVPYPAWRDNRDPTFAEMQGLANGNGGATALSLEDFTAALNKCPFEFAIMMRTNQQLSGIIWSLGGFSHFLTQAMCKRAAQSAKLVDAV